jgi:hypothetical protein
MIFLEEVENWSQVVKASNEILKVLLGFDICLTMHHWYK